MVIEKKTRLLKFHFFIRKVSTSSNVIFDVDMIPGFGGFKILLYVGVAKQFSCSIFLNTIIRTIHETNIISDKYRF